MANNEVEVIANNYGFNSPVATNEGNAADVAREVQQVQAQCIIAKQFPRDEGAAFKKILKACERPNIAEKAMYSFPRGKNNVVEGPSIRLAEVIAQNWGNLACGIDEVSRSKESSEIRSFCWDMETNLVFSKRVIIPNERHTRNGVTKLTDPRDIYENNMNQGARRLRKNILECVPQDVMLGAVERCKKTVAQGQTLEQMRAAVEKSLCQELGVPMESIEKELGHPIKGLTATEFVRLKGIYNSIKDGVQTVENFFEMPPDAEKVKEEIKKDAEAQKKKAAKTEADDSLKELYRLAKICTDMGKEPEKLLQKPVSDFISEKPVKIQAACDILEAYIAETEAKGG